MIGLWLVLEDELETLEATSPKTDVATFAALTNFLRKRCRTLNSVEGSRQTNRLTFFQPKNSTFSGRGFKTLVTRSSPGSCASCKGDHYIGHCDKFKTMSLKSRRELISREHLCFNCLRSGHQAITCTSRSVCQFCRASHHSLLHSEDRKREGNHFENSVSAKRPKKDRDEDESEKLSSRSITPSL